MTRFIWGPDEALIDVLAASAQACRRGQLRMAVAWASDEAVSAIAPAVEPVDEWHAVVGLNHQGTSAEALLRLLDVATSVRVFFKHPRQTFHPKVYAFDGNDREILVVGSANATGGGIVTNFEAGLVTEDERPLREWDAVWEDLIESPFSRPVTTRVVEQLYDGGYVVSERTLQRRRARDAATTGARADELGRRSVRLPVERPPRRNLPRMPAIHASFLSPSLEPPPLEAEFFVFRLSGADARRLRGDHAGTRETNVWTAPLEANPTFWRWEEAYTQTKPERREWRTTARLVTSSTGAEGVEVEFVPWYRERLDHAYRDEFRLFLPNMVTRYAPTGLDEGSLLVVSRTTDGDPPYVVRLLTAADPDYSAFDSVVPGDSRWSYGAR